MMKLHNAAALAACLAAGWAAPVHADAVTDWHAIAVQCIAVAPAPASLGGRSAPANLLDLALVQAAVHDAVQAIEHQYEPYLARPPANGDEAPAAAAAAAAYRVLLKVCPHVVPTLDAAFAPYLAGNDAGLAVGYAAADALIAVYRPAVTLPGFTGGTNPGEWRPTPPALAPMANLYVAANVKPFTFDDPAMFRPAPPPALTSKIYAKDYNEVKATGSVQSHPAAATCPGPRKTDLARFWSGNFAALWNDTVRQIAVDQQLSLGETARLLALTSLAAADAGIAVWDSKLHYDFWRPITAINLGDTDGNPATAPDASWTPFIQGPQFAAGSQTPPYPDYVSGANGLTGAFVTTLQLFFRTDRLDFEIYKATPPAVAICTNPRTYRKLSDAAQEVVDARILLGIHFRTADVEARRLGTRVAFWAFTTTLRPVREHEHH
ncbi:MAG TPA: vanadium-dependent haloperoxidase [Gammaproteobacteria bacterium]|nr:vanadium-dependent haloperoxidase [Gammaproteobacteria bacterium]